MQIKGITDEITDCDCCGRSGLKRTVALENVFGAIVYYGTECAAQALRRPAAAIKAEAVEVQRVVDHKAARALELQARASEILFVSHETGRHVVDVAHNEPLRKTFHQVGSGSFGEWLHQVAETGAF